MEPFNTPLKIREISLPHRAVFGPMAGFTDAPARRLMAQHGAGFTVSEMVSSRALVYGDHKTVSLLKAEPNGAPYGVQIFGEVPEIMGQAAAAVEQYAFDFLDINMGCPAPKIVSGGAGSKLMLDPDRCGRIVEEVFRNTSRPVTVKMRKGWDAEHVTAVECAKACEQAGAVLTAVGQQTRKRYSYYFTCGNTYEKGPLLTYLDVMYTRQGIDQHGVVSRLPGTPHTAMNTESLSIIGDVDYRVHPQWNVYVKGAYETARVYKSNGDFRKGMYRRSWNAQSSVEFFPFKQLDLFVFVLYTYRGVILEKAATRMGAIEPDTHRISLGLVYSIPVF